MARAVGMLHQESISPFFANAVGAKSQQTRRRISHSASRPNARSPRFLVPTPINPTPMSLLSSEPPKTAGRFRLRSENFACELENFACEMKSFRQGSRKLLKSLAREIYDCAVSCDSKGLGRVLFRALFRTRLFLPLRRAWKTNFTCQNVLLA